MAASNSGQRPGNPRSENLGSGKKPPKPELDADLTLAHPAVVTSRYWHALDNGKVQCDLCPRHCQLQEGQRGLCYVRARREDQIVLASYGRSSGFCVDPIEKKPLNHFYPGSSVLSFGTAGCNLSCKFCQNWDISKSREMDTLMDQASPELIASKARSLDCRSVAYTYNDPVIFHEYAIDVASACREQGIKSVAVSAGYICEQPRSEFFSWMDAANIDLKAFTEAFYYRLTGAHLQPVLDTLRYLKHETAVWLEITTLLIPGHNDSDKELHAMSEWLVSELGPDVPLHFTAFHPDYKLREPLPTPLATLRRARDIALSYGLYYVYTGNVHDRASASTYCSHCGQLLLERDWYQLGACGLDKRGACKACGTQLHGHFDGAPGQWGAQRLRVEMR